MTWVRRLERISRPHRLRALVAVRLFLRIIGMIVQVAPIGAFGAMAFTVGASGVGALWNLAELVLTFYASSLLLVLLVLGAIARLAGFSLLRVVAYTRDELLTVLGTRPSETVLPRKHGRAACWE